MVRRSGVSGCTVNAAIDLRNDPAYLRALLRDAREDLRDADRSSALLLCAIRVLVRRAAPRPADIAAERRVLGALLLGRATPADVTSLEAGDFEGRGHPMLFAVIVTALELASRAAPGWALRHLLTPRVRAVLKLFQGSEAALDALDHLPWPGTCPREAIAVVGALARWRRDQA
jgi:hypothetical protein